MENLRCRIVRVSDGFSSPNYEYEVYDKSGKIIATGISSSEGWVKNDAGGYHTKKEFDQLYPDGWKVEFDF